MAKYTLAVSEVELNRYRLMAEIARAEESAVWTEAGIVPGATVADVGCGPAAVSVLLAQVVGPQGRVIAVEREEEARTAAERVIAEAGVGNVELRAGEATATGIEPGSVDVAMMRHVLAHNGGSEQAIVDHLASLVRPGGSVYLVDVDLTAIRVDGAHPDLDDMTDRYVEFHRRRGNDPQVGLRLGRLVQAAGLELVQRIGRYTIVDTMPGMRPPPWAARDAMVADGVVTSEDVARWGAALDRMDETPGSATVFAPGFVTVGRKPAT